jgi:hypothetical protein
VMRGRDSKVGEDAASECAVSNAFNAIVETNISSKRVHEGSASVRAAPSS